jgi:thiol-disulfide isomerase/thioredoxin
MVLRRIGVVLLIAALIGCSDSGAKSASSPIDATFKRFDGTTGTFAEYRGKPVVVNFFSSTCVPCQTEMPALERVKQNLGDQVTFLGMDVQDTDTSGHAFVETVGITWELGLDPDGSILQQLVHDVGLPTTVILDRQGRIVVTHLGALDVSTLTQQLRDHQLIA